MNNREEIKSFLVVFEDENENEYQSSLINKESSLYLLKESIELKYNKSIIDVYYYDLEAEKCFIDDCRYIESLYNNIKFFGGNRKYDWKVLYNFENKDVPNLIDRYSSTTSLFKSDKKWLAVLDDLYPKLYAKLKNKQLIKEHNDKEGYLFIDFINIR